MKKIIFIIFCLVFLFSQDILLDRFLPKKKYYTSSFYSKKEKKLQQKTNYYQKHDYLLEIRQIKNSKNKKQCYLYVFEKINKKYIFQYGYCLSKMGKECYFVMEKNKHNQYEKTHVRFQLSSLVFIVGRKTRLPYGQIQDRKKNAFYGRLQIPVIIHSKGTINYDHKLCCSHAKGTVVQKGDIFLDYFYFSNYRQLINRYISNHLSLLSIFSEEDLISLSGFHFPKKIDIKNQEIKFNKKDLQKKGIPEPKPMWDSKVKPYKNVFGEELLD